MAENSSISNSKLNIIFGVKVLVFIALIIPLFIYVGNKYSAASTENKINTYNEKRWNEFYSLEENSLDIVFLGSSHSYCTFDPEIFDNALGTSSFQMGMPLQHLDTTYFTLVEVLNYQKPKLAVVEVYWDLLADEFELTQAGYLFQVMKNEELEKRYIDEVFPIGEKVKYKNKALRYQADYFAFKSNDIKTRVENKFGVEAVAGAKQIGSEEYRSKGYTLCTYNMLEDEFDKTNQFKGTRGLGYEVDKIQKAYLKRLVELCRGNGIEVVFATAPIANVSMEYIDGYEKINEKLQALSDELGVEYLDFNMVNAEMGLFTNENFRDDAHLNHSGVEIADNYYISWLAENGYDKEFFAK